MDPQLKNCKPGTIVYYIHPFTEFGEDDPVSVVDPGAVANATMRKAVLLRIYHWNSMRPIASVADYHTGRTFDIAPRRLGTTPDIARDLAVGAVEDKISALQEFIALVLDATEEKEADNEPS